MVVEEAAEKEDGEAEEDAEEDREGVVQSGTNKSVLLTGVLLTGVLLTGTVPLPLFQTGIHNAGPWAVASWWHHCHQFRCCQWTCFVDANLAEPLPC